MVAVHLDGGESGVIVNNSFYLPGDPVNVRLGWGQTEAFTAVNFNRVDAHPIDGAAEGTSDSILAPPFPPALNTDSDLFFGVWVAIPTDPFFIERDHPSDPFVVDIAVIGGDSYLSLFSPKQELTIGGVEGQLFVTSVRLYPFIDTLFTILTKGSRIISEKDTARILPTPLVEGQVLGNSGGIPAWVPPASGSITVKDISIDLSVIYDDVGADSGWTQGITVEENGTHFKLSFIFSEGALPTNTMNREIHETPWVNVRNLNSTGNNEYSIQVSSDIYFDLVLRIAFRRVLPILPIEFQYRLFGYGRNEASITLNLVDEAFSARFVEQFTIIGGS